MSSIDDRNSAGEVLHAVLCTALCTALVLALVSSTFSP
jgi:hypothetical protein